MEQLAGKRVFVTGGANGIGRAIVRAFGRAGAEVAFCDINRDAANELLTMSDVNTPTYFYADVSDKYEVIAVMERLFDKWGDIDIIVNNVGVSIFSPIEDISIDEFEKVLDINLRTAFITSKLLAEHRSGNRNNTYGRIVNIASTRYLMSELNSEAYAASKGGISSMTHALSMSLSKYSITVNCISPGWIENGDYSKLSEADHVQHPSGRVGVPDDIARTCLFLCQPENDFINAQNIVVDGGMTKKMIYVE